MPAGGARGLRRQRAHREGARRARRRVQGGVARPVADVCVLEGGQGDPLAPLRADRRRPAEGPPRLRRQDAREGPRDAEDGAHQAPRLAAGVGAGAGGARAVQGARRRPEDGRGVVLQLEGDPLGRRRARGGRDDRTAADRGQVLARPRRAHPARRGGGDCRRRPSALRAVLEREGLRARQRRARGGGGDGVRLVPPRQAELGRRRRCVDPRAAPGSGLFVRLDGDLGRAGRRQSRRRRRAAAPGREERTDGATQTYNGIVRLPGKSLHRRLDIKGVGGRQLPRRLFRLGVDHFNR